MEELDLKLVKVIDTHIHADHISGMAELRDRTNCITIMGDATPSDVVSMQVKDNDEVSIEGIKLKALYTPGHTNDSFSYLMNDRIFFWRYFANTRYWKNRLSKWRSLRCV